MRRRTVGLGGVVLLIAIVALFLAPGPLPGLGSGNAHAGTPSMIAPAPRLSGISGAPARSGLVVSSSPNGHCGVATWCKPVTGTGTYFGTVPTGLLSSLSNRACSVNLSAGACTASAGSGGASTITPYLNATNNIALNYSSSGLLGMAYTNYTTLPPTGAATCTPARPAATSEISFALSSDLGKSWSPPTILGTPECNNATNYPSAYDPALTSLGNGTFVLAYVQYSSGPPNVPPFLNLGAPPVSRLVVTQLYPGHSQWTHPMVVNSSKTPQLSFQFAPTRPSITAHGKTIYLTWESLGSSLYPYVFSHVAMRVSTSSGRSWSPTIQIGPGYTYSANPNVLVVPSTGELFIAFVSDIGYCGYNYYCGNQASGTPYYGDIYVDSSSYNGTSFNTAYVTGVLLNQTFGPFFNPDPLLAWGSQSSVLDLAFIGDASVEAYSNGQVYANSANTPDLYFLYSTDGGLSFTDQSYLSENAIFPTAGVFGGLWNSTGLLDLGITPQYNGTVTLEATVFNASTCEGKYCGVEYSVSLSTADNGSTWSSPYVLSGNVAVNGTSGGWAGYLTGEYEAAINLSGHALYAWVEPSCPTFVPPSTVSTIGQCGTFTAGSTTWTQWGTTQVALSRAYSGSVVSVTFGANQGVPANASWQLELMGEVYVSNGSANLTITNVPTGAPVIYNASGPGLWQAWYEYTGGAASVLSPTTFSTNSTTKPAVTFSFVEEVAMTVQQLPSIFRGTNCNADWVSYYGCPLFTPPPGPTASNINPYNCYGTYCYNPPPGSTSNEPSQLGCVQYMDAFSYNFGYDYEQFGDYYGLGCMGGYVTHNVSGASVGAVQYGVKTWLPIGQKYTLGTATWNPEQLLCDPTSNGTSWLSTFGFWYVEGYCLSIFTLQVAPEAWFGNGTGSVTSTSSNITIQPMGPVNETIDWNITGWCSGNIDTFAEGSYTTVYINYSNPNPPPCHAGNPYLLGVGGGGGGGGFDVPLSVNETGLPSATHWGISLSTGGSSVSKSTTRSSLTLTLLSGNTYQPAPLTVPIPKTGQYWIGTTNSSVSMPDFYGITVHYSIGSLSGTRFGVSVSTHGLPAGLQVTLSVNDTSTSNTTDYLLLSTAGVGRHAMVLSANGGENYSLNSSSVTAANGTRYYLVNVNVSVSAINGTSGPRALGQQTFTAVAATTVVLDYAPAYYINVQTTAGGTVTPSSGYVGSGQKVNLTATPLSKYQFVDWVGQGNGSITSVARTIAIRPSNSLTEFAVFRLQAAPTYNLTVQSVGPPIGTNFSVSVNGTTYSGSGTISISNVTGGLHSIYAPVSYSSYSGAGYAGGATPAVRYLPGAISSSFGTLGSSGYGSLNVSADTTLQVTYSTSYLLTLQRTSGGVIGGAVNGQWVSRGTILTLTAAPSPGYEFIAWNGSGPGSYSGTLASVAVTMNNPVTEFAEFILIPPPSIPKYTVNVTEQGLPSGVAWNATISAGLVSVGGTSNQSQIHIVGLVGSTYVVVIPTVYGRPGVRYEPNGSILYIGAQTVNKNETLPAIAFTTQYELTVLVSGNGTVTGYAQWEDAKNVTTLTATAAGPANGQIGWKLSSWNSTTPGVSNQTGVTYQLTMNGPVTIEATFVPAYQQKTTTLTYLGAPEAFGLLAVLLVAGLAVGFALSRRRRGGGSTTPPPEAEGEAPMEAPVSYDAPPMEAPSQHEEDWSESASSA